jgi:hypothetical protein
MAQKPASDWTPHLPLPDLDTAKPKLLDDFHEKFTEWAKAMPVTEPLPLTTGWHVITPQMAEDLLRRNQTNRKLVWSHVQYIAGMMRKGEWVATGQTLCFDEDGNLTEGQHRLYGCLMSNSPFETFVVTGVKKVNNLFAFYDNAKSRTPADALRTAGYNGVSATAAAVIKIAEGIKAGVYTASTAGTQRKIAPHEFLELVHAYPNAVLASRLASSDYEDVVKWSGHKDIIGYLLMAIMDIHGQEVADEFFREFLYASTELPTDSPILAFRKLVEQDRKKIRGNMKRHQFLGNLIKCFNLWHTDEKPGKRWFMAAHEGFPTLSDGQETSLDDAA